MKKLPEINSVHKAITKIKSETYKDAEGKIFHRKPIAVKMTPECSAHFKAPETIEGLPVLIKKSLPRPFVISVEVIRNMPIASPYKAK